MKAILVNHDRSLRWDDVPDPVIKPDELLVRIEAAALNRADLMQREGDYPIAHIFIGEFPEIVVEFMLAGVVRIEDKEKCSLRFNVILARIIEQGIKCVVHNVTALLVSKVNTLTLFNIAIIRKNSIKPPNFFTWQCFASAI